MNDIDQQIYDRVMHAPRPETGRCLELLSPQQEYIYWNWYFEKQMLIEYEEKLATINAVKPISHGDEEAIDRRRAHVENNIHEKKVLLNIISASARAEGFDPDEIYDCCLPSKKESSPLPVVRKVSRRVMIETYKGNWPSIRSDIQNAHKNGLAMEAKAGGRGWIEEQAVAWAKTKGRYKEQKKPVEKAAWMDPVQDPRKR